MKLRGLPTPIVMIILAGVLALASIYLNSQRKKRENDMKNQLTTTEVEGVSASKRLKAIIAKNLQKQDEMIERTEFSGGDLLIQERFYTEVEINEMSEVQFQALLKETELKMPKLSDIKKLPPAALHRTPAPVIQAGRDLGLIKEILKVHGSYEKNAAIFYNDCAKNAERPTPVRALCLTNFIEVKKKNGEKINRADYPAEILELSRMVTDL